MRMIVLIVFLILTPAADAARSKMIAASPDERALSQSETEARKLFKVGLEPHSGFVPRSLIIL